MANWLAPTQTISGTVASSAEVTTGSNNTKFVSPSALNDSHPTLEGLVISEDQTDTSNPVKQLDASITVNPGGTAQASLVNVAAAGTVTYENSTQTMTAGTHQVGVLGHAINNGTITNPLLIAAEGKIDGTHASGTITDAVGVESQLATNAGTITNFWAFDGQITGNAGTVGTYYGHATKMPAGSNSGVGVTAVYHSAVADLDGPITTIAGLLFTNQTLNSATTKHVIWNLDADAKITTNGDIDCTGDVNVSGITVQDITTETTTAATGTTAIDLDNTSPLITEGTEFMTVAITPKDATNILHISYETVFSTATNDNLQIALFDDTNTLIDTKSQYIYANLLSVFQGTARVVAGSSGSELTFKLRAGRTDTNTLYFNSLNGSPGFNGSMYSRFRVVERRA